MAEPKVAAAAAAAASVTKAQEGAMAILVHPLVVMNIADHYSRTAMQLDSKAKDLRVVGALWGTQKGREVHVRDSMELLVKETPDGIKVVESELKADFDLCTLLSPFRSLYCTNLLLCLMDCAWFCILYLKSRNASRHMNVLDGIPLEVEYEKETSKYTTW